MADQVVFDKTTSLRDYAEIMFPCAKYNREKTRELVQIAKEELLNHMLLEQLLKELDATSRKLIEYRYFHDMTQMQVAKQLGISQVQVEPDGKKDTHTGCRKSTIIKQMVVSVKAYKRQ